MKLKKWLFLALLLLGCTHTTKQLPESFAAKVIGIKDGDTIEVLYNGKPIIIRLAHIDCPEIKKRQPFGMAAKKFTSEKCFGKFVTIQSEGKYDRYKRLIGIVINKGGENINKELVKAGLAWYFKKYSSDSEYDVLEQEARENKRGLWVDSIPTPPWEWRKP